MLNFIIGTAGTGKSTFITNKITELAKQGEKCLLLVPEQFSKTGETMLFSSLDNTRSNLVELFSFTSLIRDVNTNYTAISATPITAAGKAVMARRAVNRTRTALSLYARRADNFGFSFSLAETFDDLKRSGIDHNLFYSLTKNAPEKNIKLKELSLIYSEYCALMGESFSDSEDLYLKLSRILPESYTENTHIFIDGFESFSHGQLKVIERLLTYRADVTVALTCDSLYDMTGGTGNFSFVQNTAAQLIKLAKDNDISVSKPVVLRESYRFAAKDLKNIDLFLQGLDRQYPADGSAFVTEFETQHDEVCFVVAQIHKLLQAGYTYNDITVVCPQPEKYENQLQESFTLAKIPYFIDTSRIISSTSPVVLFKSILAIMAGGLTPESVMPLLKTGLTQFDSEDIDSLENYFYVWQDYDFDLSLPFTLSPSGLKAHPDRDEVETLEKLNAIRAALWGTFAPLAQLKSSGEILTARYESRINLGCDEKLKGIIPLFKTEEDRQLLVRQWETAITCLDSLYSIIGDEEISCRDIETLFMLLVEGETIGFAPQTQDCVIITDPKRMKLDRVKAVFIIGAAQDIFPGVVAESGLISTADRQFLKEANYPLKNNFENLFSFENLYYYKALTVAGEKLYISRAKKNIDTRQMLSGEVENLRGGLGLAAARLETEDYRVTKEFFADYISGRANNLTRESYVKILKSIGVDTGSVGQKDYNIHNLDLITRLLGNSISISPTAAETYYKCPFSYFLQRILSVKPLEKAEFSARIAGDYLHFVAQKVMEKHGENYYKAPWDEVLADIDLAVDGFIAEKYPPEIAASTKFTAQYENMKANATRLLEYIRTEQADSLFRPIAFEERIGGDRVPPLIITEDGKTIKINGVVDRVDLFHGTDSDYLRIVDYKTGTQKFSLNDIYNGLSTQLLLYMNALLESGFGKTDKELKPGAVVYQPADAAFKFDDDDAKLYTAVGMALSNPEISAAFDTSKSGRYGVISGEDKVKAGKESVIAGEKKFNIVLDYVKEEIAAMAKGVWSGRFDAAPLETEGGKPCRYCRFKAVCQASDRTRPMEKHRFDEMEKEGE